MGDSTAQLVRMALPASMVMSFLAASSVPMTLYATYAEQWRFSPITTTVIFVAYAIAVLLDLLILGRVSDHVGRRPVLLAALVVQLAATVVLATAGGVDALIAGRVLQGLATGAALGALGAAMLDVDPTRGALANAAAPGVGTGLGALVSGLLVQYAPAPTRLGYLLLIAVFVLQGIGVARSMETIPRKPGLRAALVPKLAVPRGARGPVVAAAPILFAVWALSGLYGSLGPALARQLSGSASAVLGGLAFFLLAVVGSLTAVALRAQRRDVMRDRGYVGCGGGHVGRGNAKFGGRVLRQHRRRRGRPGCRIAGRLSHRHSAGTAGCEGRCSVGVVRRVLLRHGRARDHGRDRRRAWRRTAQCCKRLRHISDRASRRVAGGAAHDHPFDQPRK